MPAMAHPWPDEIPNPSSTRSKATALISTPAPKAMISPIVRRPMRKRSAMTAPITSDDAASMPQANAPAIPGLLQRFRVLDAGPGPRRLVRRSSLRTLDLANLPALIEESLQRVPPLPSVTRRTVFGHLTWARSIFPTEDDATSAGCRHPYRVIWRGFHNLGASQSAVGRSHSDRQADRKRGDPRGSRDEYDAADAEDEPPESGAVELRADPGEEQRRREQHHPEHVVGRALDVRPGQLGRRLGGRRELVRLLGRSQLVLVHRERGRRRRGILERVGAEPCLEGRLELVAEPFLVERGEIVLALEPGIDPLNEHRDVDLRLGIGETRRSGRLDPR